MTTSELALQALRAEHERTEQLLESNRVSLERTRSLEQSVLQLIEAQLQRLNELDDAIRDLEVAGWRVDADPADLEVSAGAEAFGGDQIVIQRGEHESDEDWAARVASLQAFGQ